MRELLDRHLGEGWADRATDPATWDAVCDAPGGGAVVGALRAAGRR